jgi:hypothetical protein
MAAITIGPEAPPFGQSARPIWPQVLDDIAAAQCGNSKAEAAERE